MEQSETPPRELTLEEAVALAILLQKNAQLVEAQELYRRVLDTAPNHPDALHYAGVLAHQQGQSDEAVTLIGQPRLPDERGGVWGTGRFPTLSRRGHAGETWFPPRERAEGE